MGAIDALKNNCVPVALREVTGLDDNVIISALINEGWTPGEGCHTHRYLKALKKLDVVARPLTELKSKERSAKVKALRTEGGGRILRSNNPIWKNHHYEKLTLGEFCKQHPVGVFIVGVERHLLTVRDGVIYDPNVRRGARRRVRDAHEIMNPAHKKPGAYVKFMRGVGLNGRNGPRYERRFEAMNFCFQQFRTVSDLLTHTKYTRADLNRDIRKGNVIMTDKPF